MGAMGLWHSSQMVKVILDFNGAREQARQKNITESLSLTQVKQVKANSS